MTNTITHNGKTFRFFTYSNGKVNSLDSLYASRGSFKSVASMTKARRVWDNSMSKAPSKEALEVIALIEGRTA